MRARPTIVFLAAVLASSAVAGTIGLAWSKVAAMNMPLAELIVGRWRMIEEVECAAQYPREVEFLEGGVYLSHAGKDQGFVMWGGGDYELAPPDRIRLQIQTDKMVAYALSASEDQLRFSDADGCAFAYRRVD